MDAFLLYILKSGICLTVFYVCFKALFSNDTFFRFNRWILLVGTGVCMLLPLCRIQTARPFPLSRPVSQLEIVFYEEEMKAFPVPERRNYDSDRAEKYICSLDGNYRDCFSNRQWYLPDHNDSVIRKNVSTNKKKQETKTGEIHVNPDSRSRIPFQLGTLYIPFGKRLPEPSERNPHARKNAPPL